LRLEVRATVYDIHPDIDMRDSLHGNTDVASESPFGFSWQHFSLNYLIVWYYIGVRDMEVQLILSNRFKLIISSWFCMHDAKETSVQTRGSENLISEIISQM
jgi:hypothetical protein